MRLRNLAPIATALLILSAVIWLSDPARMLSIVSESDLVILFYALLLSSAGMVLRSAKWSVLVGVGTRKLFPVQLLGMAIGNFTPGKVGEPLKAVLLKMRTGMAVSASLPSIMWERAVEVLVLIIFSLFAVSFLAVESRIFFLSMVGVGIFSALIIIVLAVLYSRRVGTKIFHIATKFPVLNRLPSDFMDSFYHTRVKKRRVVLSFFVTLVPWALDGIVLYLALLAVGVEISPFFAIGILALATIIGIASSLPGGIGSIEAVLLIFLGIAGADPASATAGILLSRFLTFWYGTVIGGLSFLYLGKKIDMSKIRNLSKS